ncbi:hypothetical protein AURDEDRAFT_159775 [Auricularia subglabra TFB-10046 SS5]|nr:hypothetical protein AURDEDRAFT_159775 [Auricularia subglabra TFB-10046 SS5]
MKNKHTFVVRHNQVRSRSSVACEDASPKHPYKRQAKPQKHADPVKQRDKISLDIFECNGWLHITVSDGAGTVLVKLSHQEDHIHYKSIDIPEDVLNLIENCGDQTVSQLWMQILEKYPCPNFTRKSIHNHWAGKDQLKWKRHTDQLKSAEILLEEGKKKGGLGMYTIHLLDIEPEAAFKALAWALPEMLGQCCYGHEQYRAGQEH